MRGVLAHTYVPVLTPIPSLPYAQIFTYTHTPWKELWAKLLGLEYKNRDVMAIALSISQNAIHEY